MHPAIIPILAVPHLLIPAALGYILYLDQEESITRVQHAQNIKRFWYRNYINSPMAFFVKNNKKIIQVTALKHRAKRSKLAKVIKNTVNHALIRNQIRSASIVKKELSPLSRFVSDNSLESNLNEVGFLTSPTYYNCNSLMRSFARKNKHLIQEKAYTNSYNISLMKPRKNLMTDFITRNDVQNEITYTYQQMCVNKFREELWKGYFCLHVAPKVPSQRGIVCSRLSKFLRDNIFESEIKFCERSCNYNKMITSPMHNYASADQFKDSLFDSHLMREWDRFMFENNHMHILAVEEAENIAFLAQRRRTVSQLRKSQMHSFISKTHNRIAVKDIIDYKKSLYEQCKRSPLRIWTKYNKEFLAESASKIFYNRIKREKILFNIKDCLDNEYALIKQSMNLQQFKREHCIGNVAFVKDCCNYVSIEFPENTQLVDQFLSESNLEGFTGKTVYYSKNEFRSCANCLLDIREPSEIDDLIEVAQTFKNISHLTDQNTKVSVLADSGKVEVPVDDDNSCKRIIELHFVKRDHSDFTTSQYRTCVSKIKDFLKKHEDVSFKIGFADRWLSDNLVVTLSHTNFIQVKSNNLTSDIIQSINLIKGIIFAKVIDRICWLQLANKENEY